MSLFDRIGVDLGTRGGWSVMECIEWAIDNDVRYLDLRIDDRLVDGFDAEEAEAIEEACSTGGVHLGLHPESAVNMAEVSPFVVDGAEQYLWAYLDAARDLGAEWIVVHGGYHFSDYDRRSRAAIDLLESAGNRADDVELLLENHNPEPESGEIEYMPVTIDECRDFFGELDGIGWAFTVNHAHMRPSGIEGFLDQLPLDRCGEVRIADNRGSVEEHLFPGDGTIDFVDLFSRLEDGGYDGHYMLGFGEPEDMLRGRKYLADLVD